MMAGFEHEPHYEGETDDWITPRYIINAFGSYNYFDLDPCASMTQPWACAKRSYNKKKNGLIPNWYGNVWLNPPYGAKAKLWVRRLAEHGQGVALIFARTDTDLWQEEIFTTADGFLFIDGRIQFYLPDGTLPIDKNGVEGGNAGAPSCLIAWGDDNRNRLIQICEDGTIPGAFLDRAFYTGSYHNPPPKLPGF